MLQVISDFKVVREYDSGVFAYVRVRDWRSLWLKPQRRLVVRMSGSMFWVFVDTGGFTPSFYCETAYRAWEAKEQALKAGVEP